MLGSCARAFAPYYLIDISEYSNVDAKQIIPYQLLKVSPCHLWLGNATTKSPWF
jgi:hypothetical protein